MTAGGQRFRSIRTYSEPWLERHQNTHARHGEFGTHRHPYLVDFLAGMAAQLARGERPSLLDYGCGKGTFLDEMQRSGRFRFTRGYDPAVAAFRTRPSQVYDLVTCLDVLDQTEPEFVDAIVEDVAQFTGRFAVFDVITVQTPRLAHLKPRSTAAWAKVIGRRMSVAQTIVRKATAKELQEGACPERSIFVASPNVVSASVSSGIGVGQGVQDRSRTISEEHLEHQRRAHASADGYGRHRHLYLQATMREIVRELQRGSPSELSWLDYGCGKGGFIQEIERMGLFAAIRGYDPAVPGFAARPEGTYDLVTCLDVLDTVEPDLLDNVIADVAASTGRLAVFDCLTRPKAGTRLHPHPPSYWTELIGRHMNVVGANVEYPGMESFERVIVKAEPKL